MVELQNVVKPVLVIAKLFMNKRMKLQMRAALDFCSQKLYFVKLERAVFFVLPPISWVLSLHLLASPDIKPGCSAEQTQGSPAASTAGWAACRARLTSEKLSLLLLRLIQLST